MPKGALELALWLEADRHGHLLDAVNQANLDNQRDVVKEEKRQRYDNQPYGNALIDVYAAVFPDGHPYHHPTIGSMEDLDAASLEDVHAFFRRHYAPDNTRAHPVRRRHPGGRVRPRGALLRLHRGRTPQPRRAPVEALGPLTEPVRVERREDVPNDRLHVAFRLPVDETEEFIAAGLALDALGGLASSRLVRRLVRARADRPRRRTPRRGASSTASPSGSSSSTSPTSPTPTPSRRPCVEELERFAVEGPTEAEMDAAMAQAERGWLSMLASQEERADALSPLRPAPRRPAARQHPPRPAREP